ncbi:MAG: hypothetical protein A2700_01340 [Candidatus Blackburnbacteria bacterium RIFCSPHIGHO2_01_FULL_44_64]|uniref:Putative phage metallopeptidase domain-containing protein n=1 Tax=Candidatus Blackburnbacteria bacterium RIFCSPHIGHO2_02_FULL_44_20 TaxID=1797516 RepID=A0A1G1V6P3_9BACT|nr:MAG: hypothetical protein A2700_01340 [Candidatus Blackburnbacteria bacterium RIFCSPHIGHO2_01_FULL_44_64]OGY10725.1 MAG: hypothetical protein A3E16_01875 [Candidatus Blackburnbacteria bacterium RIFCSPHIGHO2_12_FULL_44_25]OGY11027.1 MAG: hypothetical protein A3D26_03885 [Candidatus Blackburnbacteria bacterium RIFCSPHIGHO2_02_FULL_44_20]OGY15221.1 MAG: hypothetical protein A3A62_02635 [Candidatus Blackburnbacteria bacterium RIFCSPLOWO2_01_FULL_44_43]OGY15856.1 MAG: hypothetical protein A3H88_0
MKRRKKRSKIEWHLAKDIEERIKLLTKDCQMENIQTKRIFCYESTGANTRAYARIWGLNRIWQRTLETEPAYILEVISEKFRKLSPKDQDHVLIHELLHVPKNFSGALVAHRQKGGVNERRVRELAAMINYK